MVSVGVSRSRLVCPCGNGESEEVGQPGESNEEHVMLCPDCKDKYVYDPKCICRNHKVAMRPRGWVRKGNYDMAGTLNNRSINL